MRARRLDLPFASRVLGGRASCPRACAARAAIALRAGAVTAVEARLAQLRFGVALRAVQDLERARPERRLLLLALGQEQAVGDRTSGANVGRATKPAATLYAPHAIRVVLETLLSESGDAPREAERATLYLHTGGLEGLESQLDRYRRAGMLE